MRVLAEVKRTRLAFGKKALAAADGPAGEYFREAGDVALCISAVDAERVQFENFAPEILIDVDLAFPGVAAARGQFGEARIGPTENSLSRYMIIAGCCSTASSRSTKRPVTCGRIASFSSDPATPATAGLSTETAK